MKVLQDLWIIDSNGTCLFKRVYKEKMNEQMFAGMLSAMNTFASQIDDDGLSSFEIGEKKFISIKQDKLNFVANFSTKVNAKKAQKELVYVADQFLKKYLVELVSWSGETTIFDDFEDEIKDSLDEVVDNFQKAFW